MTRKAVKVLGCIAVSALVLVSAGATEATMARADAHVQQECTQFEDWRLLRWFGLWSEKYHIVSTPEFNPHWENRWWSADKYVHAYGWGPGLMEGRTLSMHGPICDFWK